MTSTASLSSLSTLHHKMMRGDLIVMELAVNASTYMEPDKFFLLKSSKQINDIIALLQLIEPETLQKCEIAYFDEETDELIGEFKAKAFMEFYKVSVVGF